MSHAASHTVVFSYRSAAGSADRVERLARDLRKFDWRLSAYHGTTGFMRLEIEGSHDERALDLIREAAGDLEVVFDMPEVC